MTSLHTSKTNTYQIILHTLKIKPIRADKFPRKINSELIFIQKAKKTFYLYGSKTEFNHKIILYGFIVKNFRIIVKVLSFKIFQGQKKDYTANAIGRFRFEVNHDNCSRL